MNSERPLTPSRSPSDAERRVGAGRARGLGLFQQKISSIVSVGVGLLLCGCWFLSVSIALAASEVAGGETNSTNSLARSDSAARPQAAKVGRATNTDFRNLLAKLPPGSTNHLDLAYVAGTKPGRNPDSVQTLDLFVPPGKGPFPLVFWIHGGGWHSGGKENSGINLALKFLPKGFALASINYRLTADAPFPAQIEDCNAALIYLRQHAADYHLDPDRVGALGHSAGAHLAALMAVTGDSRRFSPNPGASVRVQAAVCWATPADLDRERGAWPKTSMMYNGTNAPLWALFPDKSYDGSFARTASPASYVHSGVPPMIIVHGAQDELVPPGQSVAFADALKKAGVPVTLRVDPDHGHDVMNARSTDEAMAFFQRILKPGKP